jgi:hemolysin III
VSRPFLRGYLHGVAAIAAGFGGLVLVWRTQSDLLRQLSLAVYSASVVGSLAVSATYHIREWPERTRAVLRRLDHAGIYALIAGTYTPLVLGLVTGPGRVVTLAAVWLLAGLGMSAAVVGASGPRAVRAAIYLCLGWLALTLLGPLAPQVPGAVGLMIAGGVMYSVGALVYVRKWPDPWPRVFGFHEVFHLCTIAGTALFWIVVFAYVAAADVGMGR